MPAGHAECPAVAAPAADVDGDGCPEALVVEGGTISAGPARWTLGEPGDLVAVGDWECDGQAAPALLRPATGDVFVFPGWADESEPLTVAARDRLPGRSGNPGRAGRGRLRRPGDRSRVRRIRDRRGSAMTGRCRLLAWTAALVLGLRALHALGAGTLGVPLASADELSAWLDQTPPEVMALAFVRLAALATGWYLAVCTLALALSRPFGRTCVAAAAARATPAVVRRIASGGGSLGLAAGTLLGALPSATVATSPLAPTPAAALPVEHVQSPGQATATMIAQRPGHTHRRHDPPPRRGVATGTPGTRAGPRSRRRSVVLVDGRGR